jgi:predicted PurR-regulated permease PerM
VGVREQVQVLQVDPQTAIGALLVVFSTIVGLVVWQVKNSARRQDAMTDRSLTFMENQVNAQTKVHAGHAEAQKEMAASVSKLADAQKENTNELKKLVNQRRRHP